MIEVRTAGDGDVHGIARIYTHYVVRSVVTFEEEPVPPAEVARRMEAATASGLPWLAAVIDGEVVGFASASGWKGRCAYRFSAEVTIYVDPQRSRLGIGSRLYEQLIPDLRERGMHTLLAGIALPNEASVSLHEKFGFRQVAHFTEVGFKFSRWVDVGYWQLLL